MTDKIEVTLKEFHRHNKKKVLICHIMANPNLEITTVKRKLYDQDFTWKKRIFPIAQDAIWYDKKGLGHLHVEVNESDGTYRFLYHQKTNLEDSSGNPIDMCGKCGDRISIDAKNVWDLVKRKTVDTFWGLDNSHVLLLLIMGIVLVIMMGALFYVIGDNQKTNQLLAQYLKPPPGNTVTGFILGVFI